MAFLCGGGFPPTAWLGQGSLGAPLQQFPSRPLPLPLERPAQDSRESGRAWGEPCTRFRVGRGRPQAEGVAQGTRWGRGRPGTTREPCHLLPGIPLQALRKTRKAVFQSLSPPPAFPCRPVIALEHWCALGAHLPNRELATLVSLCPWYPPLLLMDYLILPGRGMLYSWRGWFWDFWRKEAKMMSGARKGTDSGLFLFGTRESAVLIVFRGGLQEEPS